MGMHEEGVFKLVLLLGAAIPLGLMIVAGGSCSDGEEKMVRALKNQGFTNVQITGRAWFGCSEEDYYSQNFTALNPHGRFVEGIVCCGLIAKGCTVRW
tara:strand:+ start:3037 stop:3330 length:294 start_codon:yes stop_codon:yes gene_type:complete